MGLLLSVLFRLEVNNVNPVLKQRVQEASKMI